MLSRDLRRNDREAKQKSLAAQQRALTEYSLEKMVSKYFEEYQTLVSRR